MDLGALYFDHTYPPDCGYGYVAASRFRSAAGIYLYGRIRRTDFLPVLAKRRDLKDKFQYYRSALSEPDENEIMSASDERSYERFAALHEQAALSRNDADEDELCVDFCARRLRRAGLPILRSGHACKPRAGVSYFFPRR